MSKVAPALLLLAMNGWGQNCIRYDSQITLTGLLTRVDEAGYNTFIALKLMRPLCATPEPQEIGRGFPFIVERNVTQIQVQPPRGPRVNDPGPLDRLERLVGHRVTIQGDLWHQFTGYHRTKVLMDVQRIDPLDAGGEAALRAQNPEVRVRDVPSYEVTVNAGARLVIEVRESKSKALLVPSDEYAPHWMTGGEVVYIDCRKGYELDPEGNTCGTAGVQCAVNAFPDQPTLVRFRCTKGN